MTQTAYQQAPHGLILSFNQKFSMDEAALARKLALALVALHKIADANYGEESWMRVTARRAITEVNR